MQDFWRLQRWRLNCDLPGYDVV